MGSGLLVLFCFSSWWTCYIAKDDLEELIPSFHLLSVGIMGVHYAQLSILLPKYLQHRLVVPRDAAHQSQLPAHLGCPVASKRTCLSLSSCLILLVLRATLDEDFPGPRDKRPGSICSSLISVAPTESSVGKKKSLIGYKCRPQFFAEGSHERN